MRALPCWPMHAAGDKVERQDSIYFGGLVGTCLTVFLPVDKLLDDLHPTIELVER